MAGSDMDKYAITGLATMAGLYQMGRFAQAVGKSRTKHSVSPPAVDGPPEFIRTFRAQQNSVEFYPLSVGGLWVASSFFHPVPASLLYFGHLYGREKYFQGYTEKPENRYAGFKMSITFLKLIFAMGFLGVGHKMVRHYGNVDLWELMCNHFPAFSRFH